MKRQLSFATVAFLILATVLSVHAIYDQIATGTWGPAGNMAESRSGAAAVRLDDGRVLFIGGSDANGPRSTAEALTAGAGFTSIAPMLEARKGHTATKLSDGRVLVAGGNNGSGATLTAEIYDPSSDSWAPAGNLGTARSGHTASLLKDGKVLIAGGENSGGPVNTMEIFDPVSGNFSAAGLLNTARSGHAAAVLNDGRVVIIGGQGVGQNGPIALSSVEIYDPASGSVSNGPSLATARSGHSATTLLDGKVFVIGGNDDSQDLASAEIYNPAANTWSAASSSTARSGHAAFLLPNNANVLIVGGTSAGSDLTSVELYEPWSGSFKSTGSMATTHAGIAGAAVGSMDGFLAVAGGGSPASAEMYHFATIKTDRGDYAPTETANVSGSGWQPGETVTLTFHEDLPTPFHPDEVVEATADEFGNISSQYLLEEHDLGVRYYLTAVGASSQARTTFTDANRQININAFSIISPAGASDNVMNIGQTFTVRVTFTPTGANTNPNWTNMNAALTVPAGWTKSADLSGQTVASNSSFSFDWTVTPTTIVTAQPISVSVGNLLAVPPTSPPPGDTCNSCPFTSAFNVSSVNPAALTTNTMTSAKTVGGGTVVKTGDSITVSMVVANSATAPRATANSVAPSALTVNTTGTATGTCGVGSPASANISAATQTYTYTCTATGGNGTLTFTGSASGIDQNSAAAVTTGNSTTNSITVDSTAPSITSVTGPTNGTYRAGQNLDFTVNYNENVTVTGTPRIPLTIGVSAQNASYLSGSGTSALVFRYTVQAGDNDSDGIASVSPINLNGGTIQDTAGNNANLTFTAPNTTGVLVDTTAPTAAITYAPTGPVKSGTSLLITATFSEPMADSPAVRIAISGANTLAAAAMTKVDSTHYTFTHTVGAGNGAATVALSVGTDAAGNVITSAPTSGATFTVDNTSPTAAITYSPTGPVNQGTSLVITATFNEPMADSPVVRIAISGVNTLPATNMTKTDSTHYTYAHTVGSGDGTATVALSIGTDLAGNVITSAPTSGATFTVDNTPPGAPTEPNLSGGDDTGVSNADNITNKTTNLTFTGNADGNTPVELFEGAVSLGTTTSNNGGNWNITAAGPFSEGNHIITAKSKDAAGNVSTSVPHTVVIDITKPTVTINQAVGQADPAVTGPINFTVVFSESPAGTFATGDVSFTGSTAGGTLLGTVSGGPTTFNVAVTGMTTAGTVIASVPAGVATDAAGNTNTASTSTDNTVTYNPDSKPPIVTISFSAPDGLNNWYVHSPVLGTVDANDSTTGNSNVTAINCTDGVNPLAIGSPVGIGTNHASGSLSVSGEGMHNIACTATDSAGNTGAFTGSTAMPVVVKIDTVKPSLSATRLNAANGNGWNDSDVGVRFTCTDATSGLASINATGAVAGSSTTSPLDVTVTTEGTGQSVNGSCKDAAGNSADPASVTNINIDKTKPTISGSRNPAANSFGWNNTNVDVNFSCTDNAGGSGVDINTVAGTTLTTEGSGQSATNTGSCTDKAGNTADSSTVNNINIDKTAPTAVVTPDRPADHNTWYNHSLTFNTTGSGDALSGIDSCTAVGSYSGPDSASASVSTTCTDKAGNSAGASFNFKYDGTGPTATLSITSGTLGNNGWYTSDVTIHTAGSDSASGIESCSADQFQTTDTMDQSFAGSCTNGAGLSTDAAALHVKRDATPPHNVAVNADRPADHAGWYNHAFTATWIGLDDTSGISSCAVNNYSAPETASGDISGSCTDNAGNTSGAVHFLFKYDATGPSATLSITSGTLGNNGWYVSDVTIHTAGSDSVSGIESCSADQFQTTDTMDQAFAGSCTNGAGLSTNAAALHVKRDATPPHNVSGAPNRVPDHGSWYNHAVDVAFSGTDDTSGIDTCSTVNYSGPDSASASVNGSCTDKAGNSIIVPVASASFMYDATKPVVHITPDRTPDHNGWYNQALSFTNPGTDATSGIESCTTPVTYNGPDSATASVSADCTDNAGNSAHGLFGFMYDATAPHDVVVNPDRGPDHNGWYNHMFTATWSGLDDTSGIASCTVNNYGAPDTASGDIQGRCTDNAGNYSPYVHFLFKFDATGPSASLSASGVHGTNGWFIGDITISTTGSDSISNPTACTGDQFQAAETTGTSFNGSCTNDAGLTTPAAPLTVKLDKTAPTAVTLTPSGTLGLNGWYISDVSIHTSGSEDISNPIVCTGDQSQTTDTAGQAFHGSCTNDAGLVANATDISIKRDATPPLLTGSRTPLPNSYGWNNVDVTVNFSCSDATSSVNAAPLTPQVVSTEGAGQSRNADCSDNAGNSSHATVSNINIDKTPPVITVALDRAPAGTGWFNIATGRPTGQFTCSDGLSGLAAGACPADQGPLADGADQSVAGNVMDKAGNSASASILHIKVDLTRPNITITAPANSGSYLLNAAVASNYSCSDATSGVASCAGPVANGANFSTNPAGAHNFTVNATDVAGNAATPVTNTYNINYTFVGFLQPIDNLPVINVANAGRVIPVKWQLKDANGNLVSDLGSLTSLGAGSAPCGTAPSDVLTDTLSSPGATVFRFDGTQFIFNWQTAKNWTGCWQLVATFNDGTKQYAKFQLK